MTWYLARAAFESTSHRASAHNRDDCPYLDDADEVLGVDAKPDGARECAHCAGGRDASRLRQELGGGVAV